jgi:ribose transport system permease protein
MRQAEKSREVKKLQTEKNASTNSGRNWLTQDTIQKFAAFLSLILMIIFFSIATPYFFVFDNLITIALQTAVIGIIAIGVTFVIITAGIDLSVGSVLALSGVSTGLAIAAGVPIFLGVLIGMMVGTIFGFISAWLVSKLNIPPFIATLGLMLVARGLTLVLTEGKPVYFNNAPFFKNLSAYKLFGTIPLPVIYFGVIAVIAGFILKKTAVGRYIYAVGSNEEAARLSGINIVKTKFVVYAICGLLSAISGIILAARLNSAQPTVGNGYELDAIAAAVIGGTSLMGGEGTILGTIIGAFIMGVLKNGLNLMNVSQFWQMVAMGLVVIGAVYLDTARKKK